MTMSNKTERAALRLQLSAAERAVAEGQPYLTRQEAIIAQLERDGHDTTRARLLLATMHKAHSLDVEERDRISAELQNFE